MLIKRVEFYQDGALKAIDTDNDYPMSIDDLFTVIDLLANRLVSEQGAIEPDADVRQSWSTYMPSTGKFRVTSPLSSAMEDDADVHQAR